MNLIDWSCQHLDYRCIFYPVILNIAGESEEVRVRLMPADERGHTARRILIERSPHVKDMVVYLSDLDQITDTLYYFSCGDVDGCLNIPLPEEQDDGC